MSQKKTLKTFENFNNRKCKEPKYYTKSNPLKRQKEYNVGFSNENEHI